MAWHSGKNVRLQERVGINGPYFIAIMVEKWCFKNKTEYFLYFLRKLFRSFANF